ncbi:MAG: DNA polymerase III subunit delta' [SAR86 cluster bacterium]|uniref:DNA-directed DNA polymerase n=1 Tax=SAR86 cluster bacterium TaxID=2030880 RepID=A0A2A5B4S4_9GAMM|nr:MAG: DNA polymerase III subunit delta' [SAR86 cluster bacterium]
MSSNNTGPGGSSLTAPLPWQLEMWERLISLYERKQLAHAYLFQGNVDLGKSAFVSALAHTILCQNRSGVLACGECKNCKQGGANYHPDIFEIAPEEGSKDIKIGQIRDLSEFVLRTSHSGAAKIAIIYNAHRLNANAANALLKTLEEPGNETYLFLVTDLPGRLVATIRSRCQKINFPAPTRSQAGEWLNGILGKSTSFDELLNAVDNNPIRALQIADGDQLKTSQQFVSGLCDLASGQVSIQFVLGLIAKTEEVDALQHLASTSSILIKRLLTNSQVENSEESMNTLYKIMSSPQNDVNVVAKRLLRFYTEVVLARRQLAASTNPNPQLIMESLLWHWSRIVPIK